jgi:hypothetical protein
MYFMKKHYQIEVIDNIEKTLYYPKEAQIGRVKRVAYGTFSEEVTCIPHPNGQNIISISQDIANSIKLPDLKIPLHLFSHEGVLYLGPLVGIFTSGFTPFPLRPIGERSLFFSKLLSVEKLVGAHSFLFGEEHINWEQGTIQGLFYLQNGWETIEVPFPNVIYDRLPNRRSEKKARVTKIKERLQSEYLIPWYNPGFFNKMDVNERLQQDPMSVRFLPETHPFTSFSMVERMLADYGHVFIKPINGSLGLGIHQVIYDKEQEAYYCRYRDYTGENRLRKYQTLEGLFRHVFRNRKLSHMLVQQGIHSIRVDKRTVDFRVHTNKDEQGSWKVTALAAKVAKPGSVTTHINNGGVIKTISEIFETREEQKEAVTKLKEACLSLSRSLESNMEGVIGEIGFDMGIDREGRVWLFEANSKPGRSIFKHPQLKEFDLLTRKLSLAFSVFLTEQSIMNPEEMFK